MPARESSTRIRRTKPYRALCVILGPGYEDFNESTVKNANYALQMETKRPKRRKAPNKNVIEEEEEDSYKENEPARLMEEFQKAEDFELCIERHKPDRYVMNGRRIVESSFNSQDNFLLDELETRIEDQSKVVEPSNFMDTQRLTTAIEPSLNVTDSQCQSLITGIESSNMVDPQNMDTGIEQSTMMDPQNMDTGIEPSTMIDSRSQHQSLATGVESSIMMDSRSQHQSLATGVKSSTMMDPRSQHQSLITALKESSQEQSNQVSNEISKHSSTKSTCVENASIADKSRTQLSSQPRYVASSTSLSNTITQQSRTTDKSKTTVGLYTLDMMDTQKSRTATASRAFTSAVADHEQNLVTDELESMSQRQQSTLVDRESSLLEDSSMLDEFQERSTVFKSTAFKSTAFKSTAFKSTVFKSNINTVQASDSISLIDGHSTLIDDPSLDSSTSLMDEETRVQMTMIIPPEINDPLEQLLFVCKQTEVIEFEQFINENDKPVKLGEGSYGEVFKTKIDGVDVALKIVPFTVGNEIRKINDDFMQSAAAILPEAIITQQLSLLSAGEEHMTHGFTNVVKMCIVKGDYPKRLLDAWDMYKRKNKKNAINESPTEYSSDSQLYIAIALELGGIDLEKFKPKNEKEAMSILIQLVLSLQVAEKQLEFEHRDLHIGNVLVKRIDEDDTISNRISDTSHCTYSHGVKATIIDFTNSRINKGGTTIFLDLSLDSELFAGPAKGDRNYDYQFDIYREMRNANNNDWSVFTPKTNCLWLHYLSQKLFDIRGLRVRRRKQLQEVFDKLLLCEDLGEFCGLDEVNEMFSDYFLSDSFMQLNE